MAGKTPTDTPRRPSLAAVASRAGVSPMTVSYALRNSPKISEATAKRVRLIAAQLGYRPNPEMGRLMHLMRDGRVPRTHSNVAILEFTTAPRATRSYHTEEVIAGTLARATELGFSAERLEIDVNRIDAGRLTAMLIARGVAGVIIPPLPHVLDCEHRLAWQKFSVVAATYSALNLTVDRVVPHHFHNTSLVLDAVVAHGYRRIGVIHRRGLEERFNFALRAMLALRQQSGECEVAPIVDIDGATSLRDWFRHHHPEVILTADSVVPQLEPALGMAFPGAMPIVLFAGLHSAPWSGIDELSREVGRTSMEQLAAKIQRGDRGLTSAARVVMIEGRWVAGITLTRQKRRGSRRRVGQWTDRVMP